MSKFKIGDEVRLKRFEGGPGFNDEMEPYIGRTIKLSKGMITGTKNWWSIAGYSWPEDALELATPKIKPDQKVKVSNDDENFIDEGHTFHKTEGTMFIVKSPQGKYKAFKYIQEV
jgi:hypothetical protein